MRVNMVSGLELGISGLRQARIDLSENLRAYGAEITWNSSSSNFDIMHVVTSDPRALPFILRYKSRKPIVMHVNMLYEDLVDTFNFAEKLQFLMNPYFKNFYKLADVLITPTDFSKRKLMELGLSDKPIIVISNGTYTKKLKYAERLRNSFRRAFGIPEHKIVIYSVGRLSLRKGITTFANMARRFKYCEFVWVGPEYPRLLIGQKELIEIRENAPENLHFLGEVNHSDIINVHCGGDIFLFPSHYENEGIAVLEAASCSRPLVLRDIGVHQRFRDGHECFKCGTDEEFEHALNKLIHSQKLRRSMGRLARTEVLKSDIKETSRMTLSVYEGLVGR